MPARERMLTLDALRGFALLGILVPNVVTFAWPMAAMADPAVMGPGPWNERGYQITATLFLGKFMFLFALMFGAGVVLYDRKFRDRPGSTLATGAGLWHKRCAVLLVIGLVHAYFFWYGDILTYYAIAGLTLLWWVRRLPAQVQIWGGLGLYVFGALIIFGFIALGLWAYSRGEIEEEALIGNPTAETAAYLGSWAESLRYRAAQTLGFQLMFGTIFMPALWGIMTLGMGLARTGILTGERSLRFHATLGVTLTGLGLALTLGLFHLVDRNFEMNGFIWQGMAQLVGVPLAIGYSQLVVTFARLPAFAGPARALANVGRMALTNYLMHTLICTTVMYGYGLGRFGSVEYPALFALVIGVWIANFAFSALWLRYFDQGPAEWLWRKATYGGRGGRGGP